MKSWSVDLTYEEHYGVHYEEHCQQAEAVIKDYSTLGSDPIIASVLNLITDYTLLNCRHHASM